MMAGSFLAGERRSKCHLTHTKTNSNRMGEILAVEGGAGSRSADGGGRIIWYHRAYFLVYDDPTCVVRCVGYFREYHKCFSKVMKLSSGHEWEMTKMTLKTIFYI